jgi:uncharacterized repeat protein (TIGR01451 family)
MGKIINNKTTIGLFITVLLSFLFVTFLKAETDQRKRQLTPQDVARLKGSPDTAGHRVGPKGIALAVPPTNYYGDPPPPPYDPAAVTFDAGMTGLVVINNISGIHFIDPRAKTISEIMLSAYDHTIDPETGNPIGKSLGSDGGGRFDLCMSRDGRLAAISNFGDSTVYFVDLSTGSPVVLGHVEIDFFAEDMDFTPDGQWLFVTDGGFSNRIARIHVPTRQWVKATNMVDDDSDPDTPDIPQEGSWILPAGERPNPDEDPDVEGDETIGVGGYACTIDVSSDGRTVVVADYFSGAVQILLLNPVTGDLSLSQSFHLTRYNPANEWVSGSPSKAGLIYRPVNIAISPNGRTVLVNNVTAYWDKDSALEADDPKEGANLAVFTITAPGHAVRKPDVIMPYPISTDPDLISMGIENYYAGEQSVVFSRDGNRAYTATMYPYKYWMEADNSDPFNPIPAHWEPGFATEVHELVVSGGNVHHGRSVRLPSPRGTSQLFGVDNMATSPDGNFLWLTNPTLSGARQTIDVVNVRSMTLAKQIGTPSDILDPREDPADEIMLGEPLLPAGIAFPETPIYLSLEALDAPAKVAIDEPFTFRILLSNLRVGYACGIHINQLLPEGIEILSATADKGEWQADEGLWYIHELPRFFTPRPGEDQATLTVTAKGTTLGNKAFQYWINKQAGYDPNRSDDEALFTVKIADRTDLGISAQASTLTPVINSAFTLTLTVQNLGPNPAGHVTVAQPLPSTWTVSGATPSLGSYDAVSGTWTIGALAVNGSATLQLTLTGTVLGQTSLTFPVSDTDSFDPVPGNDTAPLSFEVVKVGPPLNAVLTRFENDLIFKKEWVNKLTWQHNTVNSGISSYRIMRKVKGAADSSYALLTNVSGSLTQYADRRLEASQLFTYKISAVNSQGEESPGLVVGN